MPALLEQDDRALSLDDVRNISRQLADDLAKLPMRSEGFSTAEYLQLDGTYLVELHDGKLQVLPMPNSIHQSLIGFLFLMLRAWASGQKGTRVMTAPFRIRLSDDHYREPDLAVMLAANAGRCFANEWDGADFVVEVVSDSNRQHDTVTKRREYAQAGIGEYWILDPKNESGRASLTQLVLEGDAYVERASLVETGVVKSSALEGFTLDMVELMKDARENA